VSLRSWQARAQPRDEGNQPHGRTRFRPAHKWPDGRRDTIITGVPRDNWPHPIPWRQRWQMERAAPNSSRRDCISRPASLLMTTGYCMWPNRACRAGIAPLPAAHRGHEVRRRAARLEYPRRPPVHRVVRRRAPDDGARRAKSRAVPEPHRSRDLDHRAGPHRSADPPDRRRLPAGDGALYVVDFGWFELTPQGVEARAGSGTVWRIGTGG